MRTLLRRMTYGWAIIFVLALGGAGKEDANPSANASSDKTVTPQLTISLERQTLRESDHVPLRVLLADPADTALSDAKLTWHIPGFLAIQTKNCPDAKQAGNEIDLGVIAGQSSKFCEFELSSSTAAEGDFTLFFELQYQWKDKAGPKASTLSVEKTVKSAFLGTDNLAGVPLALAGFVVPGLLFWMVLDWWGTPWRIGTALGDKMIYSVIVSVIIVAAGSKLELLGITHYLNLSEGISIPKLFFLALAGAVVGTIVGGADYVRRKIVNHYQQKGAIHFDDQGGGLLEKMLKTHPGLRKPLSVVREKDGTEFQGSLYAKTSEGLVLIGWSTVPLAKSARAGKIREKANEGKLLEALRLAIGERLQPGLRNPLRKKTGSGTQDIADWKRTWKEGEYSAYMIQETDNEEEPVVFE